MYVYPDKCRKAFHFDLDYHAICEVFGRKNTATPYSKIKSFMLAHGFEKAQYSGYISKEPMSETDFYQIYNILKDTFPWFESCAQKAHVSLVLQTYDLLQYGEHQSVPPIVPTPPAQESLQHMQERKTEEAKYRPALALPTHIEPSQER